VNAVVVSLNPPSTPEEAELESAMGDVQLEFDEVMFDDFYQRRAHCVLVNRGLLHPQLHGAVRLVETRICQGNPYPLRERTGREVHGNISAMHPISSHLVLVHYRMSGRTFAMRNEMTAHPEQNQRARHYFGVPPDAAV
jgi:hypothetical protein